MSITLADRAALTLRSREEVRIAINDMGVSVPTTLPFRFYADKIREIEDGGGVVTGQGEPMSVIGPRYDIGDYNLTVVDIDNSIDIAQSLLFSPVEIGNNIDVNQSLTMQPINIGNAINAAPYAMSFVTVTLV